MSLDWMDYEYFKEVSEYRKENPYFCEWCKVKIQSWKSHKKTKHNLIRSFQIKPTPEDHKKF